MFSIPLFAFLIKNILINVKRSRSSLLLLPDCQIPCEKMETKNVNSTLSLLALLAAACYYRIIKIYFQIKNKKEKKRKNYLRTIPNKLFIIVFKI